MRAREIDRGLEAARRRRRQARRAAALRRLQLHEDGAEALRQRVVNVARDAVALFEHRLAPRFEQALFDEPAVVERQRRLPRRRIEQRTPPAPLALESCDARQRDPAERLAAAAAAARPAATLTPPARLKARTGFRQPLVVTLVLDDRRAAFLAGGEMPAHALARQIERGPAGAVRP